MFYVELVCRMLLGVVFVAAAGSKLRGARAYGEFVASVREFIPRTSAPVVAIVVVTAELATVGLLAYPGTVAAGYALAVIVLVGFSLGIGAALRTGRRPRCRCFGANGAELNAGHLIRNAVLSAVAVTGLIADLAGSALGAAAGPVMVALGGGALAGLLMTRWDDLMFLLGRADVAASN